MAYDADCECTFCMAERTDMERLKSKQAKINARKPVDWDKPLQIVTRHGTFKVFNLGIGWKDKRLVQIEENSTHDGTLPNVFAPDDSGYVVQFDRWIENVPQLTPEVLKVLRAIMIETEVRQGPDYGKLYASYPSLYGAGCLIDGLRNKGFQITKL